MHFFGAITLDASVILYRARHLHVVRLKRDSFRSPESEETSGIVFYLMEKNGPWSVVGKAPTWNTGISWDSKGDCTSLLVNIKLWG